MKTLAIICSDKKEILLWVFTVKLKTFPEHTKYLQLKWCDISGHKTGADNEIFFPSVLAKPYFYSYTTNIQLRWEKNVYYTDKVLSTSNAEVKFF